MRARTTLTLRSARTKRQILKYATVTRALRYNLRRRSSTVAALLILLLAFLGQLTACVRADAPALAAAFRLLFAWLRDRGRGHEPVSEGRFGIDPAQHAAVESGRAAVVLHGLVSVAVPAYIVALLMPVSIAGR